MAHSATFRSDDPAELVAASLSCPVCLSGRVAWRLEGEDYDPSAVCECGSCGHRGRVYLEPLQALRLALAGPVG